MDLTRKNFLQMTAGAATYAAMPFSGNIASASDQPASGKPAVQAGKPKRGVSIFCYQGLLHWQMTMEDVFREMHDMNATGFELLASGYIENYPNPTDEWMEWWHTMLNKYNIVPVEYGHWVDSKLHRGKIEMSNKESYDLLAQDIKLAHKLGFTCGRTKLGVIDGSLTPVTNWREFIKMALPLAEENNFVMQPDIHNPTLLKSKMIDDYVEFIEKENTKWFGLNIDFGVFAKRTPRPAPAGVSAPADSRMQPAQDQLTSAPNQPEDIIPLLPYIYCCHAKFNDMSEDMVETTIPYDKLIKILIDHKWDGYLLSEYEGINKNVPGYPNEQTRRHHVLLKNLLGEV